MGLLRLLLRALSRSQSAAPQHKERATYQQPTRPEPIKTMLAERVAIVAVARPCNSTIVGPCWVIDGDTIVIDKIIIRLFGIDAPESDQPYGQKAKWTLLKLCKGQVVRAVFDGSLSHDRSVAVCYLPDGRDLSAEMVKSGMALDWPKYSGGLYREFETPEIRRLLWRADARQKGGFPPTPRA